MDFQQNLQMSALDHVFCIIDKITELSKSTNVAISK